MEYLKNAAGTKKSIHQLLKSVKERLSGHYYAKWKPNEKVSLKHHLIGKLNSNKDVGDSLFENPKTN